MQLYCQYNHILNLNAYILFNHTLQNNTVILAYFHNLTVILNAQLMFHYFYTETKET